MNYLLLFVNISIFLSLMYMKNRASRINCNKCEKLLFKTIRDIRNSLLNINNNNLEKSIEFLNAFFLKLLKNNLDSDSILELKSQKNIFLEALICNKFNAHLTNRQLNNHKIYLKELGNYRKKYKVEKYSEEVFFYHHGLKFSNEKILRYIIDKDIVDVGSYIGDSLLVLMKYTHRKIHLYEFSLKSIKKIKDTIKINNIAAHIYSLHQKGLSNFIGNVTIVDYGNAAVGIGIGMDKENKKKINVSISTLDREFYQKNNRIGFIKADVEGEGYNFVLGAKNIIITNRPVMNIAIYHNYDEYFKIQYLIESIVDNYNFEYHLHNSCDPLACEFDLFAYPNEIKFSS